MNRLFSALLLLVAFVGQAHLELLVRKPVETEQTFPLRRIVHKLDLKALYPLPANASLLTYNASVIRTQASPNFKFDNQFVFDHDSIYFLTSVDRPATLRVNLFVNSTITPGVTDLRKYTRVFTVKDEKPRKSHVFELKVNGRIDDILKSEKAILDQFENKLWKGSKPSIAFIKTAKESYYVGIAGSQKHSDLLDEFCFLNHIPYDQLKIADLDVIRSEAKCGSVRNTVPNQNQPTEEFVINAMLNVGTKPLTSDRFLVPLAMGIGAVAIAGMNIYTWKCPMGGC